MKEQELDKARKEFVKRVMLIVSVMKGILLLFFISPFFYFFRVNNWHEKKSTQKPTYSLITDTTAYWQPSKIDAVKDEKLKLKMLYGKELIAHTSRFLGPKGKIKSISNGMNCQNCHLDAGTKIWGNNYGSVASLYPKFRARSGSIENLYKRINDCIERSLNGSALDTTSKEILAIAAYINYIGSNTAKGKKAEGSGLKELPFLTRAASIEKGKNTYERLCMSCHKSNGQGLMDSIFAVEYVYPPLWGEHSYNDAAGLYRLSNLAKYVKYNMPLGASYLNVIVTDEEAWDVAAFINSQPRPHKDVPHDWPDITKKPIDHPFGKYADTFSEIQHKYGPYQAIKKAFESLNDKSKTKQ
jgi:thiosulfate dehydrogenase